MTAKYYSMLVASLDLKSITHYWISISASFGQIFHFFFFSSFKLSSSRVLKQLTWLRSLAMVLSNFLSDSFTFLRNFAYVCLLLTRTVCITLLTAVALTGLYSDHVHQSHHAMTSFGVYTVITNSTRPIKR